LWGGISTALIGFNQETEENPYTGNYNGIALVNTINYTFMYDYMSTAYTYYTSYVDKSYEGGATLASSQNSLAVLMNKYYYSAGIVFELQSNYNSKTTTDKMPDNEVSAIFNRHKEVGDSLKENNYDLGYHVNGGVICNVPKIGTAFFISNNSFYVSNKTAKASTKYRENNKFSSFDLDFNELLASISKYEPEKSIIKVETNSFFSDSYFQDYEYTLLQPSINIAIGDNSTRFDLRANLRYNIDRNKLFSHEYIVSFAYHHTIFALEYTNINNYFFSPASDAIYSKSIRFLFGFQYVDILSSDVLDTLGL